MDKTVAGVLTTVTALALGQAQAAPAAPPTLEAAMQARSYADLLQPIPNALALLQAEPVRSAPVQLVADDQPANHHHHHRRRHRAHHAPPPHHHHHHHHHNQQA